MDTNRWVLCTVDKDSSRFNVMDKLLRKRVSYYVPNLVDVSIEGNHAYINTLSGKKFFDSP